LYYLITYLSPIIFKLDLSSISLNPFRFGPYAPSGYPFIDELFTQLLGLLFDPLKFFFLQSVCYFALYLFFFELLYDFLLAPFLLIRLLLLFNEELIED
jgi:hypothetical protein